MITKSYFTAVSLLLLWHTTIAQLPNLQLPKNVRSGDGSNSSATKVNAVTSDASGNVYKTGSFSGTAVSNPGPKSFYLTAASGDIIIQKSDASSNFVWAKRISVAASNNSRSTSIAVDAAGNVYTAGSFRGTVDFDPGEGTFNLTSAGTKNIFIQKLDASGLFIWAKSLTQNSELNGSFIASLSDASGKAYTKRALAKTADFDPVKGTSNSTTAPYYLGDIFTIKLDAAGNFMWANSAGSTGQDIDNSIALDASGNMYCTGTFSSTVDFVPNPEMIAGKASLLAANKTSFSVYPNPTYGNFVINLQLNEEVNKDAIVQVYNALGKLVITSNIPMVHGVMFKEMKLDKSLAAGMYSVCITVNNKILNRQVIYQR